MTKQKLINPEDISLSLDLFFCNLPSYCLSQFEHSLADRNFFRDPITFLLAKQKARWLVPVFDIFGHFCLPKRQGLYSNFL